MTERQVFARVRLPLAAPVILAGIRTATVMIVGITTIAAYIAAGGLGTFVRDGLASQNRAEVIAATICIVALAFFFDAILATVQRLLARRPAAAAPGKPNAGTPAGPPTANTASGSRRHDPARTRQQALRQRTGGGRRPHARGRRR